MAWPSGMPKSSRALGLGAAVVVLTICACGSGSGATGSSALPAPAIGAAPAPRSLSGVLAALPLQSYVLTVSQRELVVEAQGILEVRCMARLGYGNFRPPTLAGHAPELPGGAGAFGYVSLAYAAEHGFRPAELAAVGGLVSRPSSVMTPREEQIFGACGVRAQRYLGLGGSVAGSRELAVRLERASQRDTAANSRVIAATRRWARCMAETGIAASNPAALARGPWPGSAPSAAEIVTAKTDARCTSEANLAGIYFAVLTGYQRELIAGDSRRLAAIEAGIRAVTAAAARVVARHV
jgi:hypothetical protein